MKTETCNNEIALFQLKIREKAVKEGKNPDTLFAIDPDVAFDVQPLIAIAQFDGPEVIAEALDTFIFKYLLVASSSNDSEIDLRTYNNLWVLKRLRDAFMCGMPNNVVFLDESDSRNNTFSM